MDEKDVLIAKLTEENALLREENALKDIRMMKVKQKLSGGFRTTQGAKVFVTIRFFISIMRKQGNNIFDSLAAAVAGNVPSLT